MDLKKNARLRELLNKPGIIVAPGCHDGITARLVQTVGFDVCYMTGNGSVGSLLGMPDVGIASSTEMTTRGHQLSECIDIPLICDSDTGYGDVVNVFRTVREYEAAGVSGIHLEDQTTPKKCGDMDEVKLISAEEMVEKIKVAIKARRDPNFVIIARTDSYKRLGIDEAIRRCKLFSLAGVDVVMPEDIRDKNDMIKLTTAINNTPILYDVIESFGEEYCYSDKELEGMGYKIVIHALGTMLLGVQVFKEYFEHYKKTGSTTAYTSKVMPLRDYQTIMNFEQYMSILHNANINFN
jgi:2-methylisocitrate lyase-like PEP mutase family enzyme